MSASPDETDHVMKVLVLGDAATGKTSIIKRYVHNFWSQHHKSTIGVDFALKQLKIGNKTIRLQMWDIAGQDRFGAISRVYYQDAVGAMLVYDLTNPASFENVIKWKAEIDAKVRLPPNDLPIPVILLGNKSDLTQETAVDTHKMQAFAQEHGFIHWYDTSAKTNHNIEPAAKHLVEYILNGHSDTLNRKAEQRAGVVRPTAPPPAASGATSTSGSAGASSNSKASSSCC